MNQNKESNCCRIIKLKQLYIPHSYMYDLFNNKNRIDSQTQKMIT